MLSQASQTITTDFQVENSASLWPLNPTKLGAQQTKTNGILNTINVSSRGMSIERQNDFHADLIEATNPPLQKTLFTPSEVWIAPILRIYATDIDNLFCNKQSSHC